MPVCAAGWEVSARGSIEDMFCPTFPPFFYEPKSQVGNKEKPLTLPAGNFCWVMPGMQDPLSPCLTHPPPVFDPHSFYFLLSPLHLCSGQTWQLICQNTPYAFPPPKVLLMWHPPTLEPPTSLPSSSSFVPLGTPGACLASEAYTLHSSSQRHSYWSVCLVGRWSL